MKKMGLLLLTFILVAALAAGCGGKNEGETKGGNAGNKGTQTEQPTATSEAKSEYADGSYYAEGSFDEKSGWKEVVALQVKDGKIVSANWNGLNKNGGVDKKTASANGSYGMVAKGKAQAEWHEQAAKMEQYLVEQQSLANAAVKDDGKTDAVSGVSIGVSEFAKLVDQALKAGPVEAGAYKDGSYFAEQAAFDEKSGWKENVAITVMNGKIVAVGWNGTHKDGGTDKVARSKAGEYGMVKNGGAKQEWHEQALSVENFLIEKQDLAQIVFNEADGKTDAVSGVSINVGGFVELATKALADAK